MEFQSQINIEKPRKSKYWKFYIIAGLVTIGVLIFLGWSFSVGSGESNLGGWLILIIPSAISNAIIFIGLSLILKFIFNKIFNKERRRPILITILNAAIVTTIIGYFSIPKLFVQESSYLPLTYAGIFFVGIPAVIIVIFVFLLKAAQPDFWRFNFGPAILTYSSGMFILLFVLGILNFGFTKALACNFVSGDLPRFNCYRAKAIKTGDLNLCIKKRLDLLVENDCAISVAVYKKDSLLCELPIIKNDSNTYDICLYEVSTIIGDKSLCDKIQGEHQRTSCLNYRAPSAEEIDNYEKQYELAQRQRPALEKLSDFFRGYY